MKYPINRMGDLMNKFWDDFPNINKELVNVKDIIKTKSRCFQKDIERGITDLVDSGGKLLRPAFVILSAGFGKYEREKINNLAAVVEMLHMATLVHDDIVDDAHTRRGAETVQSKYGKDYAVFMGDYLFAKCFMLLSNDTSMENIKNVAKSVSKICIGEIDQFANRFKPNTSVKKYLKRISAKTSALFALSCYIGASESGCDEKFSKQIAKAGYYIGMAFQIIDDILDYSGDEKTVGKPLGNDLKQGVFTVPLIYALKTNNKTLDKLVKQQTYTEEDIKRIIEITKEEKGIEKARELAEKYTKKAFKQIEGLPDNENKEVFNYIAKRLLTREY